MTNSTKFVGDRLPRIEALHQTPAAMRFLSIEPLLEDLGPLNLEEIDWAIVGGESGPGARRMDEDWVHSIRRQCKTAKVPFFFKQWGGVRKSERGRLLDGKTFDDMPERQPPVSVPKQRRLELIEEVASWGHDAAMTPLALGNLILA